jgi:hypothetical protein
MHDVDHSEGCSIDVLFMGDDVDRRLSRAPSKPASDHQAGIAPW